MAHFEKVSKYADADLTMPVRKTSQSAGYDMVSAEDYVIPSLPLMCEEAKLLWPVESDEYVTLDQIADFTKKIKTSTCTVCGDVLIEEFDR